MLRGQVHALKLRTLLHAGLAGLVNAALIGIVLLCLTPVFRHMPLNALAAIVITGVIGLLDFPRVIFLLKVSSPSPEHLLWVTQETREVGQVQLSVWPPLPAYPCESLRQIAMQRGSRSVTGRMPDLQLVAYNAACCAWLLERADDDNRLLGGCIDT